MRSRGGENPPRRCASIMAAPLPPGTRGTLSPWHAAASNRCQERGEHHGQEITEQRPGSAVSIRPTDTPAAGRRAGTPRAGRAAEDVTPWAAANAEGPHRAAAVQPRGERTVGGAGASEEREPWRAPDQRGAARGRHPTTRDTSRTFLCSPRRDIPTRCPSHAPLGARGPTPGWATRSVARSAVEAATLSDRPRSTRASMPSRRTEPVRLRVPKPAPAGAAVPTTGRGARYLSTGNPLATQRGQLEVRRGRKRMVDGGAAGSTIFTVRRARKYTCMIGAKSLCPSVPVAAAGFSGRVPTTHPTITRPRTSGATTNTRHAPGTRPGRGQQEYLAVVVIAPRNRRTEPTAPRVVRADEALRPNLASAFVRTQYP